MDPLAGNAWPPPYDNEIAAPAGEPATSRWAPSKDQLEYAHKGLQVVFMGLALIGVIVIFRSSGARAVVRGAARKHAVA